MDRKHPRPSPGGTGLPPPSPFERLTRVHALMVAGETAMTVALADSLFLSISPDAARGKVILFLAISMAPFAVVAPLIGPFIDRMRGGQRSVVMTVGVCRALVLVGMANQLDSLTLFPLAFGALILSKTYAVSKSALVPVTVSGEAALVGANSRLGQVAGMTGFVVAAPAALLQFVDARLTLALGVVAFLGATMNAYRLPKSAVSTSQRTGGTERTGDILRVVSIARSSTAMRILRATVGFTFFHLAFWLRSEIAGTAWFGLAIALSGMATLGANFAGPHLRDRLRVDTMMFVALSAIAVFGAFAAWADRIIWGILLAAVVNAAAAIGRLSFESTVQSEAPDADRGRAFARFEAQNQLAWVVGGLLPVILAPSSRAGSVFTALIGLYGAVMFARAGGIGDVTPRDPRQGRSSRARDRGRRPR